MDKMLKDYKELIATKPDRIEFNPELVKKWLDTQIDAFCEVKKMLGECYFDIHWGNRLYSGEYEHTMASCEYITLFDKNSIQLYHCVRELADILNVEVIKVPRKNEEFGFTHEISFMYRGFKIYEIGGEDL